MRYQPYFLSLALAMLLTGCGQQAAQTPAQAEEPVRPVRTITVGAQAQEALSFLPGEVRARYEQRLGFRVPGKIARRAVEVGEMVKPGQLLAVLDPQDVEPAIATQRAQLEAARTDLKLQQAELRRVQELRDKGFIASAQVERQQAATDAAAARVRAAESALAQASNALAFQKLTADRAGQVLAIEVEAGSVVAAGQPVMRLALSGERELAVNIPERSLPRLKQAKGFAAVIDALPGKVYALKLRELAPAADPASRTYAARFAIQGAGEEVKLGMSATVQMRLAEAPALVIPTTALYTRDEKPKVWVVDPQASAVRSVEVVLGETTPEGVVVRSGLKPGDRVVTAGANLLLPGQKVRLLPAPAAGVRS